VQVPARPGELDIRQREGDVVKTVAFVFGLCIGAVGAVGILAPSGLVWLAQLFVTPGPFYVIAAVRIAFGLILISVAPASRAPRRSAFWATSS
jgi:hypothetical protein